MKIGYWRMHQKRRMKEVKMLVSTQLSSSTKSPGSETLWLFLKVTPRSSKNIREIKVNLECRQKYRQKQNRTRGS